MSTPDTGRTPDAPDVDQPDDGTHGGEDQQSADGRTPSSPGVDEPDGGASTGSPSSA
jgi:hypothetical protein